MIGMIKMRNPDKRERDIPKTVLLVKETEKLATEESMKKDKYELKVILEFVTTFLFISGFLQKNRDQPAYGLNPAGYS